MSIDHRSFLESRRQGLGGSDMAAIFGQSQWATRRDIWLDKTCRVPINNEPNLFLDGNSFFEPFIASQYERISGNKVNEVDTITHPEHSFLRANIDRQICGETPGILEIKNLVPATFNDIKHNGMKIEYIFQMQFYFLCTGYTWGEFAVMDKLTYDLLIIPIEPDLELMQLLKTEAIDFWHNNVLKDIEPSADKMDAFLQVPRVGGDLVDMNDNPELDNLLSEYDEIKEMESGLKELKSNNAQAIANVLGEAEGAKIKDYHIYNRYGKPRITLDAKAIEKELPEIYDKYKIESKQHKSLRVYKRSGEN